MTKNCGGETSIRLDSFFSKSRLLCKKIMQLAYFWLNRSPVTSIISMTGCSSRTITAFNGYFRQLCADSLNLEDCLIGGPGIIVEVDETKLGKRKYHRGHSVEGVWVVGGIERTEQKRVFISEVENRNSDTLLQVLGRYIRPGSIVYTDMWRGYSRLEERLELEHWMVNHSEEFVNIVEEEIDGGFVLVTKVHTNTIEATWCGLKLVISKRNRTRDIQDHLWEYVWRKQHSKALWSGFLEALKDVSYN